MIDALVERFPGDLALVEGAERLTFIEVVTRIRAVGQALRALGLGPGDRVAILMQNTSDLVFAMQGALWAGLTIVPLNVKLSPSDHAYMVRDAAARVLLYHGRTAAAAEKILETASVEYVRTLGAELSGVTPLDIDGQDPHATAPRDVDPEAEVFIQYTGGTTGLPKGVVHSHRTLLSSMTGVQLEWGTRERERYLHCTPLTHGGVAGLLPIWLRGGTNYLLGDFDATRFLDLVEEHAITSTHLVPTMITVVLAHPELGRRDLGSLETLVYGGSSISPSTLGRAVEAFGPILVQCYGQTECYSQISGMDKQDHICALTRPGLLSSAGRPVAIAEVRIADEDGNEVPLGERGEILVRGPHVFLEYLNKPEETAVAKRGGWLHTGDLGHRDAYGYLYVTDRMKDMIISGGFNVYPREVEDVLDQLPGVREVCVVGLPDEKWGERVTAVVVSAPDMDQEALAAVVRSTVRDRKGPVYAPKTVYFVDALPLTSVGKVDKRALVDRFSRA
ncbi:AMP-binding protein [Nocardia sp. CA2R105]|uniref:AMP-binding protein n=1 Tax=Nocardia coffeae TaxID=2873381 RepID=UPI001CA6830C|nr:AMP-binding protein [Nocardia coffeae]MBY8858682.1 AMP-binding protein [Nocardia coffeae]